MRHYQNDSMAADAVQLCPSSPWQGIEVTRYRAPSRSTAYEFSGIVSLSLVIKVPQRLQSFRWGRWQDERLDPGTMILHPPGTQVSTRWEGEFEAVNIAVDMEWLRNGSGLGQWLPQRSSTSQDPVLKKIVRDIELDCRSGAPSGTMVGEALVLAMLYRHAALNGPGTRREREPDADHAIKRAIDYIRTNLDQPLAIATIAQASGFGGNLHAFARAFKRRVDATPHGYVLTQRLDLARKLIESGEASVTQVALACGFINMSHFSDAFKKRWGHAPSSLRRGYHATVAAMSDPA